MAVLLFRKGLKLESVIKTELPKMSLGHCNFLGSFSVIVVSEWIICIIIFWSVEDRVEVILTCSLRLCNGVHTHCWQKFIQIHCFHFQSKVWCTSFRGSKGRPSTYSTGRKYTIPCLKKNNLFYEFLNIFDTVTILILIYYFIKINQPKMWSPIVKCLHSNWPKDKIHKIASLSCDIELTNWFPLVGHVGVHSTRRSDHHWSFP